MDEGRSDDVSSLIQRNTPTTATSHSNCCSTSNNMAKRNIYGKYFRSKVGIGLSVASLTAAFLLASVGIIALYVYVYIPFRDGTDTYRYPYEPGCSFGSFGIGIVSSVLIAVSSTFTIAMSTKPSFMRCFWTFCCTTVTLAANIGLTVVAIAGPVSQSKWLRYKLLSCNCTDADGTIIRNGTDPDWWECQNSRSDLLKCDDVDNRVDDIYLKSSLNWIIVAGLISQSVLSLGIIYMCLKTFFCIGDTIDKAAEVDEQGNSMNQYEKNFQFSQMGNLGIAQLGFLSILFLLTAACQPQNMFPWQLLQLIATASFVTLNWITTPGRGHLTYVRISGIAVTHLVGSVTSIVLLALCAFSVIWDWTNIKNALYPFLTLEIIGCTYVVYVSLRAIRVVENAIS